MAQAVRRFFTSSLALWVLVTLYGIYFLYTLKERINFGIDLVGGTYITLEVQTDKLFESELVERVSSLHKELLAQGIAAPLSQRFESGSYLVTYATAEQAQKVEGSPLIRQKNMHTQRDGARITFTLGTQEKAELTQAAVEGNIQVLRSRVDRFGVGEVPIAAQGEKSIVIELPNVQDVQKAKSIIGTSALLEVKPVLDSGATAQDILNKYNNCLPEGTEILPGRSRGEGSSFYLVPRHTDLTGRLLKSAQANPSGGDFGMEPVVEFEFKPEGGDKFYELTNKPQAFIAMIVDGVVVTAAVAREPLRSRAHISGNFTLDEAQELASMLRSGAFAAPVTFEEDRTIGPSLGADSIRRGLISCLVGLLLLFLFSVIVYKVAGLFAFVVLLYNLLLILFALSWLGATLTLPGIAGIVLTIGMAIDASILIYERIREELARGSSLHDAVNAGFAGATVVILDANITHFLVAVVLYKLGAGVIQGFAVSMIIGIVATLVTGLWLLKSIFTYIVSIGVKRIKI